MQELEPGMYQIRIKYKLKDGSIGVRYSPDYLIQDNKELKQVRDRFRDVIQDAGVEILEINVKRKGQDQRRSFYAYPVFID